ncbi:MAG: nitrogen fixation protein FixH [Verrucomicrobiales bacterium]|jgi:nitrogen fixation protein FixH|nr:nitrogen fixation protein FixH [Verrucomicrobiales bacterium]
MPSPSPILARPARSLWPIAITAFFLLAICGVITFINWAVHQNMDLVSHDYYKEEILYQQQIDSLKRTRQLGGEVSARYNRESREIAVTLPTAHYLQKASGTIKLYRPSDASLDYSVPLLLKPDGTQKIRAADLRPGLWKVRIQWNAAGQDYSFDQPVIID